MTISYVPLRLSASLLPRQGDMVCESRSMIFGSTKFGRSATLRYSYSQLWWQAVTFSFTVVKYHLCCNEAPPSSLQGFTQSAASISSQTAHCGVKKALCSQEDAKTECLLWELLLPMGLPPSEWPNSPKASPPVKSLTNRRLQKETSY